MRREILLIAFLFCSSLFLVGRGRLARLAWIAALAAVCLPLFDFTSHVHWDRVGWIPFVSPPIKRRDVVANLMLYVPFGFLSSARDLVVARGAKRAIADAAILSLMLETSQLFSHSRYPSATDVACNVGGAALGIAAFRFLATYRAREPVQTGAD